VQQRNQGAVLFLNASIRRAFPAPAVQPLLVIFVPGNKVFGCGAAGSVKDLVRVDGYDELRILEKLGNIIVAPVADVLCDAFHDIHTGLFALYHNKRNTVHQNNKIRTGKLPVRTFHFKFICHLKNVIILVFKVNEADIKRLPGAVRKRFFQTLAGAEKIVAFFIGSVQPGGTLQVHRANSRSNGAAGKEAPLSVIGIGLAAQIRLQFLFKQHRAPRAALFLCLAAGDNRISQLFDDLQRPIL